jgi:uncharacterized BrkB/YihY/UPF0761 family membrane protein
MTRHLIYIAIVGGILLGMLLPGLHIYSGGIVYMVGFILILNFFEIDFRWQNFLRYELILTVALSALAMPLLFYVLLSRGWREC